MSPLILEDPLSTKKTTVGCQTVLSLPVDFHLDKILGKPLHVSEHSIHVMFISVQILPDCQETLSGLTNSLSVLSVCLSSPTSGEYYRLKEVSQQDQVQDTMSSSSLRRKLFLDGQGSGSESSSPPSPEGGEGEPPGGEGGGDRDFLSPMSASPLPCPLSGMSSLTPSTVSVPLFNVNGV